MIEQAAFGAFKGLAACGAIKVAKGGKCKCLQIVRGSGGNGRGKGGGLSAFSESPGDESINRGAFDCVEQVYCVAGCDIGAARLRLVQ